MDYRGRRRNKNPEKQSLFCFCRWDFVSSFWYILNIPISLLKGKWKAVTYEYDNTVTNANDSYYSILEFTDNKIKEITDIYGEQEEINGSYYIEGNILTRATIYGSTTSTITLKDNKLTLIYNDPLYFIGTIVYQRQ